MRSERTTQETEFTPKEMAMILRTLSECIGFGTVAPVTEDDNYRLSFKTGMSKLIKRIADQLDSM